MINRAKMPRQLRDKGGIASVTPRKKYGLGSKLKERFRKLVPNELADIAVKAAPFVAPFNPGIAGLMRGIGRFDQRGSISDAFKQGVGTFAAGQLFRQIGGAGTQKSFLGTPGDRFTSPLSADRTTAIKDFFNPQEKLGSTYDEAGLEVAKPTKGTTAKTVAGGPEFVTKTTKATIDKIPIINKLPEFAKSQILVGGATGAITYVYEAFLKEEPPQEEGETYDEYMARRKENVGRKMRSYFDNYFKFDRDYSAMTDEQKDAFIARVNVRDGGRIGYQTGGVTMANTLAENIRRNLANQAAVNQMFQAAASKAFPEGKFQQIKASSPTQKDYNIRSTKDLVENLPGGIAKDVLAPAAAAVLSLPYDAIQASQRMEPGSGIAGFVDAFKAENPISSLKERTTGAAGPLAERLSKIDLGMSKAAASEITTPASKKGAGRLNIDGTLVQIGTTEGGLPEYLELDKAKSLGIVPTMDYEGNALGDGKKNSFDTTSRTDKNTFSYTGSDGKTYYTTYEGLMGYERLPAKKGGIPTGIMRTNKAGVMERDYRDKGGFVPVGIKEKADDVPAMLSKNEFVFTADAVRGAGNGSIEKGAQRMYDTMKKLEKRVV